jgi:uncharacterized protein (DUF1778 family)
MPQAPVRTARIEARIAPDALAIVKRAAEIQGRSVSDFVVAAAQEAAQRTIEKTASVSPSKVNAPLPKRSSIRRSPPPGSRKQLRRIVG